MSYEVTCFKALRLYFLSIFFYQSTRAFFERLTNCVVSIAHQFFCTSKVHAIFNVSCFHSCLRLSQSRHMTVFQYHMHSNNGSRNKS
uniref:Putative secreted protein n=1 Tax=Xenopsylla cheopis TaxID=163159 RepID=A0A6M2DUX1_XENCH